MRTIYDGGADGVRLLTGRQRRRLPWSKTQCAGVERLGRASRIEPHSTLIQLRLERHPRQQHPTSDGRCRHSDPALYTVGDGHQRAGSSREPVQSHMEIRVKPYRHADKLGVKDIKFVYALVRVKE